ncbi:MAG TPA: galactokinase [Acidimicrobiia bacterium]|nr:galactokinase [Acidimicrobiia bacterium]
MPADLIESARQGFDATYGSAPSGVWFAPGRINVIGEHTDYNDGLVLPFALDRGVAAAATLSNDGRVDLVSGQFGSQSFALDELSHRVPGLGHAEGAVWAAINGGMEIPGLKVYVDSTVPAGAGLSSSSAFICALLVAANDLTGRGEEARELALAAQRAETDGVGVPIGVMDPMVSMLSRQGHALLLDCQSLEFEHVPFRAGAPGGDTEILIVDTRTERNLAAGEYGKRRRDCERAASVLGLSSLRGASASLLEEMSDALDEVSLKRARHVVSENARVLEAVKRLRENDVVGIGTLLDESHRSLAEDFEVSSTALDLAVEVCREAGAHGARLTGAGFAGCVIGLFPSGSLQAVDASMTRAFSALAMRQPRVFTGSSGPPAGRMLG